MKHLATYGVRWALVLVYLLLVFSLPPLLLEHAFTLGSPHEHSDQDVCAWLDHAASAGVHSVTPPATSIHIVTVASPERELLLQSVAGSIDPVRGPPFLV
jgi:hypothetical protein